MAPLVPTNIAKACVATLVLLPALGLAAVPADAITGTIQCVGWWGWYWKPDTNDDGRTEVHVVAEFADLGPGNQCAGLLALTGSDCTSQVQNIRLADSPWACVGANALIGGEFYGELTGDRCDNIFVVNSNGAQIIVVGGETVVATWTDGNGWTWHIVGNFVGHTCLNDPVRGAFSFSASRAL